MEKKKRKLPIMPIAIILMFLAGAGVFLYPTISNYFAEKNSSQKSDEYKSTVAQFDKEMVSREKQKAIEYNEALAGDPVRDPFIEGSGMALPVNYLEVMNINGIICTIEIPKINVKLPVLHGTSKEVLDKAVGHVRQTAFPIGGLGNHTVLTGHTGLSHAKLFTDLIKLEIDDIFMINVLQETLFYKIDDISVIIPEDIEKLEPIEDEDHVTLVTCTPYGVNSHRLLVRGIRTAETGEEFIESSKEVYTIWDKIGEYKTIIIVLSLLLLFIIIIIIYIIKSRKDKENKERKKQYEKEQDDIEEK